MTPKGRARCYGRGMGRLSVTLLVALLAGCLAMGALSCVSMRPEAQRERSVSRRAFERVRPFLEDLSPGDNLRLFAGARTVQVQQRRSGERVIVIIPAWIISLSGGPAGGVSMLGQLIGRRDDVVYGSHVFGFVSQGRIVPRYQVITRATLVDPARFEALVEAREPDIGALPRPSGMLYFRELHVVATRALDFSEPEPEPEPESEQASEPKLVGSDLAEGELAAFYSEAAFRETSPLLDGLPVGTDLFSLLWILGAEFVTDDFGESHSLLAQGFLNYKQVRTRTVENAAGVAKLRPFGWVDGEREVVERIVIFDNDRLTDVIRHDGRADWLEYLD